jgi:hypothetical protein
MNELDLNFALLEDKKDHNLYMSIEDVLRVLRWYQDHVEDFMNSDFTFIERIEKGELN